MDLLHGSLHGRGDTTFVVGTSNGDASDARAEDKANKQPPKNNPARVPITNRVETLAVLKEARSYWDSLGPLARVKRLELAAPVEKQVRHYQQHINDNDHTIAAVARRKAEQYRNELRGLGFYIPGIDPKGKT
jgi:hypothetical protein